MVYVQYPDGKRWTYFQTSLGLMAVSFDYPLYYEIIDTIQELQALKNKKV